MFFHMTSPSGAAICAVPKGHFSFAVDGDRTVEKLLRYVIVKPFFPKLFMDTKAEHGVTLYQAAPCFLHLLNFLLQISEDIGMKKLSIVIPRPSQSFFYGRNGGAVVPTAYDIVDCGLRDSTQRTELVNGNVSLIAQL